MQILYQPGFENGGLNLTQTLKMLFIILYLIFHISKRLSVWLIN